MATVMMSSLILTMINGCFDGGVIIISAEAALDTMCGASNEWFCSPNKFDSPGAQNAVLPDLKSPTPCKRVYDNDIKPPKFAAYVYSSCADKNDPNCGDCLNRATEVIYNNCPVNDGAQYGTEECCARYELTNFCGA
ncbi:unnamed protein product [Linum trigynum]